MVAEIGRADEMTMPRISQLTQKTNQFNLTTRRYTEGDIRSFADNSDMDVFSLRLRDRVSDLGLIGVAIVRYHRDQAEIDSFLLSCRAIGRGAEEALLAHLLHTAHARGCRRVIGHYRFTKKNGQVADFYPRQKFRLIGANLQDTDWELLLDQANYAPPNWITVELTQYEGKDADN
jgi:FkbH-like protein